MSIKLASTANQAGCIESPLIPFNSEILEQKAEKQFYAIKNTKVSNDQLRVLSLNPEIIITEVKSPLSNIDPEVLSNFLQVHGANIKQFNMQNVLGINDERFIHMMNLMPHLETLSLQYEHEITNEGILAVLKAHPSLSTIILSDNREINKDLFLALLQSNRAFKMLSLNLGSIPREQSKGYNFKETSAHITQLSLGGRVFNERDLEVVRLIKGLESLQLRCITGDIKEVSQLVQKVCSDSSNKLCSITVTNPSLVEAQKVRKVLKENLNALDTSVHINKDSPYTVCIGMDKKRKDLF